MEFTKVTLLDIWDRTQTGPTYTMREWDTKIIPMKVAEKVKSYGLKGVCDPRNPVSSDDGLADSVFKAAWDLALDTGVFCISTERVIKIAEDELKEALKEAPSKVIYGEGKDEVVVKHRRPEDKLQIATVMGPFGNIVSEELFIPVHQSVAQYKVVDGLIVGNLATAYNREIRAGTPIETLAGKLEAKYTKEAVARAGRPGMPIVGVETSPTAYGFLGGYGMPGGYTTKDIAGPVLAPVELKTDYAMFHKIFHIVNCGGSFEGGTHSHIGGYAGGPEGAAVTATAAALLYTAVFQSSTFGITATDIRYMATTTREAIWANSLVGQAISRNTHRLTISAGVPLGGCCTDMILNEISAAAMNDTVSGRSGIFGVRPGGGKYRDCSSGLECYHAGSVARASQGLKRTDANEIVKKIIPKYEDKLKNPPRGKLFTECFNLKTLKPSEEWLGIEKRVAEELKDMGLPM